MEQIIPAERVFQRQTAPCTGRSREGDSGVGLCRRREVEVGRVDVGLLGGEHELQALVFTLEERHVFAVFGAVFHLDVVAHIVFDDGLFHGGSLGVERELHLIVLQHHALLLSLHGRMEEGCGVGSRLLLFGLLAGGGIGLLCLFEFSLFCLRYGILHECRTLFLGRWLAVPAVSEEERGYQHHADDCILIH